MAVARGRALVDGRCHLAIIAAILFEGLWIALAVVAVVILGAVAITMLLNGDWWWN